MDTPSAALSQTGPAPPSAGNAAWTHLRTETWRPLVGQEWGGGQRKVSERQMEIPALM